jgi:hypothetical protein
MLRKLSMTPHLSPTACYTLRGTGHRKNSIIVFLDARPEDRPEDWADRESNIPHVP